MCGCIQMQSKWCAEGEMSSPSALHTLLRPWHLHSPHCNLISTSLVPGLKRIMLAWDRSSLELPAEIREETRGVAGVWGAASSLQPFKLQIKPQFKLQIQRWGDVWMAPRFLFVPPEISMSAICKMSLFSNSAHKSEDIYPQHILSSRSSPLSFLGSHIRQGQRGAAVKDADKLSDSLFKKKRAL